MYLESNVLSIEFEIECFGSLQSNIISICIHSYMEAYGHGCIVLSIFGKVGCAVHKAQSGLAFTSSCDLKISKQYFHQNMKNVIHFFRYAT